MGNLDATYTLALLCFGEGGYDYLCRRLLIHGIQRRHLASLLAVV